MHMQLVNCAGMGVTYGMHVPCTDGRIPRVLFTPAAMACRWHACLACPRVAVEAATSQHGGRSARQL
jgi:hypothetical protein